MRWAGHVAGAGERRGLYRVLVGKPEGKRPFGRPRRRWEYNIKMDLERVGCGGLDWIELIHYHIHKCLPPLHILSQLDPVHNPTSTS